MKPGERNAALNGLAGSAAFAIANLKASPELPGWLGTKLDKWRSIRPRKRH
ncbi:MAG: hypothetical protein M5R42_01425 [Rhodocyclaceae bacterium]|nr:hypothetical protein [Rhodocyclaceae bacterium]